MSVLWTDDDVSLLCADSIRSRSCGVQVSPSCCLDDGVDTFHDKLQRENTAGSDGSGMRQPVQSVTCSWSRIDENALTKRENLEVAMIPQLSSFYFITYFRFTSCTECAVWDFCMAFSLHYHITLSLSICVIYSNKGGHQRLIEQTVDSISVTKSSHTSSQVYLAPWPKVFLQHDATIWVAMATTHTSTDAHIVHRNLKKQHNLISTKSL